MVEREKRGAIEVKEKPGREDFLFGLSCCCLSLTGTRRAGGGGSGGGGGAVRGIAYI